MPFIARQRLLVAGGVVREVGEAVPEAEDWDPGVRQAYINMGQLEETRPAGRAGTAAASTGAGRKRPAAAKRATSRRSAASRSRKAKS